MTNKLIMLTVMALPPNITQQIVHASHVSWRLRYVDFALFGGEFRRFDMYCFSS